MLLVYLNLDIHLGLNIKVKMFAVKTMVGLVFEINNNNMYTEIA